MATLAQRFRNVGRISQIINVFVRYGFRKELQHTELAEFVEEARSVDTSPNIPSANQKETASLGAAKRLAMAFEELGPTFVKLGQLLAAREDVLPAPFVRELKRLQDRARPFSVDVLEKILSEQFQGQHKTLFASIDPTPLGAASIGQVHKATLADGRAVVLKVQRPGIDALIRSDLSLLRSVAGLLEAIIPEVRLLRPTVVVDELSRSLQTELDYLREAANTERMRGFFEGDEHIHIPAIYKEHCTRTVLCMEFLPGQKLTNPEIRQRERAKGTQIVRAGVVAFLDMTFKFGMFHADLHPGNFMLLPSGKLAILDFGLTARLTREIRNTLSFMFLALVKEDLESFARLFMELTVPEENADTHNIEHEVRDAVDTAMSLSLKDIQIGKLLMQVARIAASGRAPVSRELVLFFRALVALESFGKSLDPQFEVLKEAIGYAESMPNAQAGRKFLEQDSMFILRDSQALLKELPFTMRLLAKRLQAGSFTLKVQSEDFLELGREIDRASNRVSLALFLGALVLGSSLLTYRKEGKLFDHLATFGLLGFGVAGFVGLWLAVSILRSGRIR
jgi:ubiquinone biosynthesis protein